MDSPPPPRDSRPRKSRVFNLAVPLSMRCKECGTRFAPVNTQSMYCSKKCTKHASIKSRRKRGICTDCGHRPSAATTERCEECRSKNLIRGTKRIKRLFKIGICLGCGNGKPSLPNKTYCQDCTDRMSRYGAKRYVKITSLKVCIRCRENERHRGTQNCKACLDYFKQRSERLKRECFERYGGAVCSCCGETELAFLCLDHVDGKGNAHRKQIDPKHGRIGGQAMYQWCKKNGYPSGFQVLCANCNHGKQVCGGVCPHKLKKSKKKPR